MYQQGMRSSDREAEHARATLVRGQAVAHCPNDCRDRYQMTAGSEQPKSCVGFDEPGSIASGLEEKLCQIFMKSMS